MFVRCLACLLTDAPWSTSCMCCLASLPPIPLQGEGAFLRAYTGSDFIQGGSVAMGPTDDVRRDMILGKELYLEVKRIEGVVLGLGVDTTDGLPGATYTGADVKNGVYPVAPSSYDDGESSDEEGRIRRRCVFFWLGCVCVWGGSKQADWMTIYPSCCHIMSCQATNPCIRHTDPPAPHIPQNPTPPRHQLSQRGQPLRRPAARPRVHAPLRWGIPRRPARRVAPPVHGAWRARGPADGPGRRGGRARRH